MNSSLLQHFISGMYRIDNIFDICNSNTSKSNMEKKKTEIQRILDDFSNFIRSDSIILKTVWMFFFLVSACACCYFIISAVLSFAKFHVTTTYRLQTPTKVVFPTITICNSNSINSNYYIHIQLLEQTNTSVLKNLDAFYNFLSLENAYKNMTGNYFSDEQKLALFDWDGFVISCTFGKRPCKPGDFRKDFFPYQLNCLVFNSDRDKKHSNDANAIPFEYVSIGGDTQSLTMELYVGLPNQISSIISHRTVYVALLNANEDPYKNTPSAISISPSLATNINLKRNVYNRFNTWPYLYNECTVNKDGSCSRS